MAQGCINFHSVEDIGGGKADAQAHLSFEKNTSTSIKQTAVLGRLCQ